LTLPYPGAAGPGQGRAPPGNGGTDLTYLCQLYAVELSISWFHTAAWAHQKTHTHTHTHCSCIICRLHSTDETFWHQKYLTEFRLKINWCCIFPIHSFSWQHKA